MGDTGDDFREWRDQKKERKRNNLEYSTNLLKEKGVVFESKNGGIHLIVVGKDGMIDFWPSTGKFIIRDGRTGRGVRQLLKLYDMGNSDD